MFDAFYKVLLAKSQKLGKVSYEAVLSTILDAQTNKEDKDQLPRSFIELSFMKATRT